MLIAWCSTMKKSNLKGKFTKDSKKIDCVSLVNSTHWPKEIDVSHYDRIMQTLNVNTLLTEYKKDDDKKQYTQRPLGLHLNRGTMWDKINGKTMSCWRLEQVNKITCHQSGSTFKLCPKVKRFLRTDLHLRYHNKHINLIAVLITRSHLTVIKPRTFTWLDVLQVHSHTIHNPTSIPHTNLNTSKCSF